MSIMVEGGLFPFTGKPFEVEYIPKETFEETIANESTSSWARFGAQCFLDIREPRPFPDILNDRFGVINLLTREPTQVWIDFSFQKKFPQLVSAECPAEEIQKLVVL